MLLLITAAGKGSRFQLENIKTPKPLIRVKGKTLLEHTLDSFNFKPDDQLLIAVQRAHEIPNKLDNHLKRILPQVNLQWIELEAILPGQLFTAVTALEQHQPEQNLPLLIHNCDTGFNWQDNLLPENEAYGSMAVFPAKANTGRSENQILLTPTKQLQSPRKNVSQTWHLLVSTDSNP